MAHSIARDRLVNREELLLKQAPKSPIKIETNDKTENSETESKEITENLSPTIQILHSSLHEKEKRLDELAVLAQKVMNFVKIKLQGGEATVGFPDDPTNKKSANVGTNSTVIEDEAVEVMQILKAAKMVPRISDLDKASDIDHKTKRIACLFNIVAINGTILRISLISIDGRYVIYQDLPISLPSLGLVDSDTAIEFATNCVDLLYIETSSTQDILKLRI
jgi:hypothetical protein